MQKLTLIDMMVQLENLSAEELTLLNKRLIEVARSKQRAGRLDQAAGVVSKFQRGDVIAFVKPGRGKNAGLNYFIFEKMNRAGIGMQGPSCDENGKPTWPTTRWTVDMTQPSVKVHMRNGKKIA